jgi:hypothetical protein
MSDAMTLRLLRMEQEAREHCPWMLKVVKRQQEIHEQRQKQQAKQQQKKQ